ncbi:hypothetical protein [Acinetobacter bereziniae]|uniref:hypothetical protein n=1 Tax=Acinetobacter bereziniae TaxID=106648 RepID=UPI002578667C|nr:hypothetical protein [Acinetobacter bereziniae]MDM1784901.1 hypothetical protein [Acinetobacter bereziniae]
MYIKEVISHRNAWDKLRYNHAEIYKDIINALAFNIEDMDLNSEEIEREFFFSVDKPSIFFVMRYYTELNLKARNWDSKPIELYKNYCSLKFMNMPVSNLMQWLYQTVQIKFIENDKFGIPILLTLSLSENDLKETVSDKFELGLIGQKNINGALRMLNRISPLKFDYPFLIIGVGLKEESIIVNEIETYRVDGSPIISQCITFQPEYYQAGVGILSYFGTVLREKYPEQNATVKIEQQDLMVRMIVESENGDKEIIEKALQEYELVISGQTPIEDFYPTAVQTLELKNQIRMLNFQLESQKEIIALKNGEILNLRALAHQALSQSPPDIKIINQLHNEQNIKINHKIEINQSYDAIDELIDLLSDESIKNQLRDIQNALDSTKDKKTPEEVKDSSGFKKLGKFLKEAKDASSNIHGVLEHTDNAAGVIEKLVKHYDKLVKFCQSFIS